MENYGILSIIPPALSIFLAIYSRNVIFSLATGAFVGSLILADFNPFFAVVNLIEQHVYIQASVGSNTQVLLVILVIGGFVHLLEKSGGSSAFSTVIVKYVSTPISGQVSAWLAGISIFFTDSGNALIVGPLFRPIFEKLNICKEKLAYIIDTTASPVSILVPFIGWGVYIMSLIENSYKDIGLTEQPFSVLLSVWPYQFYAILALLSIPMILSTGKDFGPMAKAQAKYNSAQKQQEKKRVQQISVEPKSDASQARLSTFLIPITVMLFSLIGFLSYFAFTEGVKSVHVRSGILLSYLFASFACAYLMKQRKTISYNESLNSFMKGMEKLILICFILILAWSLSSICKELHTGDYLASLIGNAIPSNLLPVIVFLLGAVMSFATGSSYGTFAILMIIVVPVAHTLGAPMPLTIAAVLSGGLFGDHTSPISDTTALASMGANCHHIDHVSTQMGYSLTTGFMTIIAFIIAGYYQSPMVILIMIVVQLVFIQVLMKFFGKSSSIEQNPTQTQVILARESNSIVKNMR
ncbi:MAG: sodium:proton exchanger [Colwellia sp.]|nr:sodium:proton exchanger [Colwellia sp.]